MRFLTTPSPRWRTTFLDALREFHEESRYLLWDYDTVAADFDRFVADLLAESLPAPFLSGRVSASYWWLMDGGDERDAESRYAGYVSIRHRLNDYLLRLGGHVGYAIRPSRRRLGYGTDILRLALPKARELGLDRVLVTCDDDNLGSRRIIEKNGGVFEDAAPYYEGGRRILKLRFWIDIPVPNAADG